MKYANDKVVPTTASSLRELFSIPEQHKTNTIILQCPVGNTGNINFGTEAKQPAFISATGSAELAHSALGDVFVKGNGTDTLILVIL